MLLQMPGEIRQEIYVHLFSSTRLTFGDKFIRWNSRKRMEPARHALAIFRTCSQINQEAGSLWLSCVLFNFEGMRHMIDKFVLLTPTTLSKIRHVRTCGFWFDLPELYQNAVYQNMSDALRILLYLRLDRLTLIDCRCSFSVYGMLDDLVRLGGGWKELRVITLEYRMYEPNAKKLWPEIEYGYMPQPSTWESLLRQRDGAESGALVKIYRAIDYDTPGAVLDPARRELLEGPFPPEPQDPATDIAKSDPTKMGKREVLFVVKRGRTADIAQENEHSYLRKNDISGFPRSKKTLAIVRGECIEIRKRNMIGWPGLTWKSLADFNRTTTVTREMEMASEIHYDEATDTYNNVEGYEWDWEE